MKKRIPARMWSGVSGLRIRSGQPATEALASAWVAAVLVAAVLLTPAIAQPVPNAENGKALFIKQGCARCHGTQGQGGAGARLAPNPPTAAALIKYVRNPTGGMPPYTTQVTDAELTDIRAYLATVPAPPPVKDIPLLNQ